MAGSTSLQGHLGGHLDGHPLYVVEKFMELGQIDGRHAWFDWFAARLGVGGYGRRLRHLQQNCCDTEYRVWKHCLETLQRTPDWQEGCWHTEDTRSARGIDSLTYLKLNVCHCLTLTTER